MKKLAERLQDIFEKAYESNQPFATREENIKSIYDGLNDADYVGSVLNSLEEIRDEYDIDKDEVNLLLLEVGKIQKMKEIIIISADKVDTYECKCGNTSSYEGFFPCDKNGNEMEPRIDNDWDNLYACARCGSIHKVE